MTGERQLLLLPARMGWKGSARGVLRKELIRIHAKERAGQALNSWDRDLMELEEAKKKGAVSEEALAEYVENVRNERWQWQQRRFA